jgi:hypothetical protein
MLKSELHATVGPGGKPVELKDRGIVGQLQVWTVVQVLLDLMSHHVGRVQIHLLKENKNRASVQISLAEKIKKIDKSVQITLCWFACC